MVDWRDWKKQLNNKKNSLNEQSSEELILIDLKSSIAPKRNIKKIYPWKEDKKIWSLCFTNTLCENTRDALKRGC